VFVPLSANVPLGVLAGRTGGGVGTVNDGAVKVTSAPTTGFGTGVVASTTVTASKFGKGVLIAVLWGVLPDTGVIAAGMIVFESVKVTDTPFSAVAVTL
jgi:hypothetical protein